MYKRTHYRKKEGTKERRKEAKREWKGERLQEISEPKRFLNYEVN